MLERLKLLMPGITDDDNKLLAALIIMCKEEAYTYCNFKEYSNVLDNIVMMMVIERFNRIGTENLQAQSSSGVSSTFESFYSDKVVKMLNKHRKLRTI